MIPALLVQVHGSDGILDGAVRLANDLNVSLQMCQYQLLQLFGNEHVLRSGFLKVLNGSHERCVLGSIPDVPGWMLKTDRLQIVLEGMTDQNLSLENARYQCSHLLQAHGGFGLNVLGSDPGHKGSVIRDFLLDRDVGVEDDFIVPVDDGYASECGIEAFGTDAHHFAVEGEVHVSLLHGCVVGFGGCGSAGGEDVALAVVVDVVLVLGMCFVASASSSAVVLWRFGM